MSFRGDTTWLLAVAYDPLPAESSSALEEADRADLWETAYTEESRGPMGTPA